jgi:nucleoside-diphosphate-sugar epimerase
MPHPYRAMRNGTWPVVVPGAQRDGMRIFITGGNGFVGSAVVGELREAGHDVVGLARSEASATALRAAGAEVVRGSLADLDVLRDAAAASDGVVHCGFVHDLSDFFGAFAGAVATDRAAIEAMGEALVGSDRPLVVTHGTAGVAVGRVATEDDVFGDDAPRLSEQTALAFAGRGVRASSVRLSPTVHGEGDGGFIPRSIDIARTTGVAGYPGDGTQRWSAVHRRDAGRLYRLAVEKAPEGARLHGVGEVGVPIRDVAAVTGRHLGLPVESVPEERVAEHFGWLGAFLAMDIPASNTLTREMLGWDPVEVGLLADLDAGHYFG